MVLLDNNENVNSNNNNNFNEEEEEEEIAYNGGKLEKVYFKIKKSKNFKFFYFIKSFVKLLVNIE
jgi:hypothetical protein